MLGSAYATDGASIANTTNNNYFDPRAAPKHHEIIRNYSEKPEDVFMPRVQELHSIEESLRLDSQNNNPSRCAIWGMAGVGKTWLIHKYLKDVSDKSCKILLRASSLEGLETDINWVLKKIDNTQTSQIHLEFAIQKLKDRLENECSRESACDGWLLVIDDAREKTLHSAAALIPAKGQNGRVLITTRSKSIAKDLVRLEERCYEVEPPSLHWAIGMFYLLSSPPSHREQEKQVQEIIEAVGSLPLAVDIAANRVRQKGLEAVWKEKHDALNWDTTLSTYEHPRFRQYKILKHAFDFLWEFEENCKERSRHNDVNLFGDLSFLDPSYISLSFLMHPDKGSHQVSEELSQLIPTPVVTYGARLLASFNPLSAPRKDTVEEVIRRLERLSLLSKRGDGQKAFIWIHSLVQALSRRAIYNEVSYKHIEGVMKRLHAALDFLGKHKYTEDYIVQLEEIKRHFQAITESVAGLQSHDSALKLGLGLLKLNKALVDMFLICGQYTSAEDIARRTYASALDIAKRPYPLRTIMNVEHDFQTISCLNMYATTLRLRGQYSEASSRSKAVIQFLRQRCERRNSWPWDSMPWNHLLLDCEENYSITLRHQGSYQEALNQMEKVLDSKEELYVEGDIEIMKSYANIADMYRYCGDYEKAMGYGELALEGRQQLLEEEGHPDILKSLNSIGLAYQRRGQYANAEDLLEQVWTDRKNKLGDKHPSSLESQQNFASALLDQWKYKYAEENILEVWKARKQSKDIGENHPDTLISQFTIAQLHAYQGQYETAKSEALIVFEMQKSLLGVQHPDTLTTLGLIALLQYHRGDYTDAYELCQQVYETRVEVLGEEHPDTIDIRSLRNSVQSLQGHFVSAEEEYMTILDTQRKVLGDLHPSTIATITALARERLKLAQYQAAEDTVSEAWMNLENVLPAGHPGALESFNTYAIILRHRGDYREAETLSEMTYNYWHENWGDNHPNTLSVRNSYALALHHIGDHDIAEEHCLETLERRRSILGKFHPHTLESLDTYIYLLLSYNKAASGYIRESLNGREDLPEDHPAKLLSRYNYVTVLQGCAGITEAMRESKEVLDSREQILGTDHPDTLSSRHQLGWLYFLTEELQEAENLFWTAFDGRKTLLGIHHSDTLNSLYHYCLTHAKRCGHRQARDVLNMELGVRTGQDSRKQIKRIASQAAIRGDGALFSKIVKDAALQYLNALKQKLRQKVVGFSDNYSKVELAKVYLTRGEGQKAELALQGLSNFPEVQTVMGLSLLQQLKVDEAVACMADQNRHRMLDQKGPENAMEIPRNSPISQTS